MQGDKRKMTKEELIKNQFPNDEFLQSGVLQIVDKCVAEIEKENTELKKEVEKHKWNDIFLEDCADYDKKIAEEYTTLQEQIADLEKENAELKEKVERYYCLLEKSMNCETCKYCDLSDDRKKEPCKSCFFDSSKWELKDD
jgi:hypothetical protein